MMENEEEIKNMTLHIHNLLQELKDRLYTNTCEAEYIAKHGSYKTVKDKYIAIRTILNAYLSRLYAICEVSNKMYYDLKNTQMDIESLMWDTLGKWEEEHSNEERDWNFL